jgi:tetratricopeptide (TPR) repeat protein
LKQAKKFEEAIKVIESSIWKYSGDYRLYEELADIFLYKWDFTKALKAVDYSLTIEKTSATWNYLKWFILLSKDEPEEAVKYLEKSNTLLWNNSEVLRNLWWAYTLVWNGHKWIMLLRRALSLSPGDDLISEDLAMALIGSWEVWEWNDLLKKLWRQKSF